MGVSDRGDNFQESYPLKSVDLVRNDATYPAIRGEHLEGRPAVDTEMNPGRGERSWSKVWYDFSQKTTLHGISQITETTPFAVRRWVSIDYSYCPFSWYMTCMVRLELCRTHAPLEVVILHRGESRISERHLWGKMVGQLCNSQTSKARELPKVKKNFRYPLK